MITISIDQSQVDRLKAALGEKAKRLGAEVAIAINATAKKVSREIAKEIKTELATSVKVIAAAISQTRKASKAQLGATVTLAKTKRISLKEFGARQTKLGVSYRVSKTQGRKSIRSAFISSKLHGHVFTRVGKSRLPIDKKHGPSPWGVFVGMKLTPRVIAMAEVELKKQIERRIRFRTLQTTGEI